MIHYVYPVFLRTALAARFKPWVSGSQPEDSPTREEDLQENLCCDLPYVPG